MIYWVSIEFLGICVWGGGGGRDSIFPPFDHPRHSAVPPSPGVAIFVAWVHMPELLTPVGDPCGSFFVPWYYRFSISPKTNSFKFHNRVLKTPWCKMNNSRMFFLIVAGKEPKRTVAWSSPCHLSAPLQMADVWKIHLLLKAFSLYNFPVFLDWLYCLLH